MPMITRAEKAQEIASLSEKFGRSKAAFLVDFKGMTVEQVTTLRKKLVPLEAEMRVVRNTLAVRALADHPQSETAIKDAFVGNNAVVFSYGEAPASAKALTDFAKEVEQFQVKTGVMDGQALSAAQITALANLPSKDVLRGMFLGCLQAPMATFVRTLSAVPSGFVRVLAAQQEKAEG
jgi:large subunit ribosomal protein L10